MTRKSYALWMLMGLTACGQEAPEDTEVETVEAEGSDEGDDESGEGDEVADHEAHDEEGDHEEPEDDSAEESGELVVESDDLILDEETRARVAPDSRGVAHILFRYRGAERAEGVTRAKSEAETLARQAYERVQGEDFGAVAAELSDDTANKDHGGEMGVIEHGLLPEPIDDALFSMEIGEVRGPIESPLGYHVLRRTE